MDDGGPMWSRDENGLFWLVFPNKHAIPQDEINKIFSLFGNVTAITRAGDDKGFRFVSYGSMEEVENAVRSLRSHPLINLIPHRPKKKSNKSFKSRSSKENDQAVFSTNQGNANFFQRKKVTSIDNSNIFTMQAPVFPLEIQSGKQNGSIHRNDSSSRNKCNNSMSSSPVSPEGSSSSLNYIHKEERSVYARTIDLFDTRSNGNNFENMDLPNLVTKDNVKIESCKPKIEVINAEELIVANIPNDYGPAFILHLFDDFEPLSISYMISSPNKCVRYCHVYFTTAINSRAVEKKFDNYDLDGKKLAVLSLDRLISA